MPKAGPEFIHQQNPDLQSSRETEEVISYLNNNGERIPNNPKDKIDAYLGFLASKDYVNDGILTGDQDSIEHQIEAAIIKGSEVPDSYFKNQQRLARERGYGDINISDQSRAELISNLQIDQREGLQKWAGYFTDENNKDTYPNWFKAYAWDSVLKLGSYDKEKHKFNKRSKSTTSPYLELNPEALSYVYDAIDKTYLKGQPVATTITKLEPKLAKVAVEDQEDWSKEESSSIKHLADLLRNANFSKLYSHAMYEIGVPLPI